MTFNVIKSSVIYFSFLIFVNVINGELFSTNSLFSAEIISENILIPRGLLVDEKGDVLVLSRGASSVYSLYNDKGSMYLSTLTINGSGLALTHGLAYNKGFLYASSGSTVYRWPYTPGQRSLVETEPSTVVFNISMVDPGKVNTRTLIFDDNDLLYVTINSDIRLDRDSHRCRIRRFNLTAGQMPFDFELAEVFADGLRNEVGLAFDSDRILWGVENAGGIDYLIREDLGGNIHDGNPAEELNKFDKSPGTHYGYPYCFGSYDLKDYAVGTQFAWPTALADGTGIHTDAFCRQESYNARAKLFMPPHEAPLGLEFYSGQGCAESQGSFPCSYKGNAIIAFHGSMNITKPVGYKVSLYSFNGEKMPTGESLDIIWSNIKEPGNTSFRPVNAVFDNKGHLIVSSDSSHQVVRISYLGTSGTGHKQSISIIAILFCLFYYLL